MPIDDVDFEMLEDAAEARPRAGPVLAPALLLFPPFLPTDQLPLDLLLFFPSR